MYGNIKRWLHPPTVAAAFLLACLCFAPYPALSQESTPSPQGEIASAVHETSLLIQQTGVLQAIAVLLAVGSVTITVAFILFIHRPQQKNFAAMQQSLSAAYQTVIQVTQQSQTMFEDFMHDRERQRERERASDETQLKSAQALERLGITLLKHDEEMSKSQAQHERAAQERQRETVEAVRAGLKDGQQVINDHTDKALEPVAENVRTAVDDLREIRESMNHLVTQERFDGEMAALTEKVDHVIQQLENANKPAPDAPKEGA